MTYLRKVWYVAGWASELAAGQMLARQICDEPLVLFRDEQGAPAVRARRVQEQMLAAEAAAS